MAIAHSSPVPSTSSMQILQYLRDGRPRTRSKLAELAGVARSTAGIRIDELISHGFVAEEHQTNYTGGRPATRVALVPGARTAIAADIGARHAKVALVDLVGTRLGVASRLLAPDADPSDVLEWIEVESLRIAAERGVAVSRLAAASVGIAAPIERSTGRPVDPPIMPRWRDFDIQAHLADRLSIPVLVEKDVNLMALGEYRSQTPRPDNLLFIKVSTGIGAGIISSGRLHRGEQGIAGDIGHIPVSRGLDMPCHCGNRGCLEAIASGPALAATLTKMGVPAGDGHDVIELAKGGNLVAVQLVRQAGRDLGEVLATCVSLFNPSSIVIGGILSEAGDQLLAGVRESVYSRSMPLATQHLDIRQADLRKDSAISGAGALAVDHILKAT